MDTNVFSFFIECFKRCTDESKKKVFRDLAFGSCSFLVMKHNLSASSWIVVGPYGQEFLVPSLFSEEKMRELEKMLWSTRHRAFLRLQDMIRERILSSWSQVKKQDRVRLIIRYIIDRTGFSWTEKKYMKQVILMAVALRLIQCTDISYFRGKIRHIDFNDETSF